MDVFVFWNKHGRVVVVPVVGGGGLEVAREGLVRAVGLELAGFYTGCQCVEPVAGVFAFDY